MDDDYCEPHFERKHIKIKAKHEVFGTQMCSACYHGHAIYPKKEGESIGQHDVVDGSNFQDGTKISLTSRASLNS